MATYTTNLNLKKPAGTDSADIGDINGNMDLIDAGVKLLQDAKTDPTASGTSATFIATISQDTNGVITATKKTVQNATSSKAGLVSTDTQTFAGAKTFSGNATFSSNASVGGTLTVTGVITSSSSTDAKADGSAAAIKTSGGIYATKKIISASTITGTKVYNAVWNDYAECRKALTDIPGKCVTETEHGTMISTDQRLMPACRIISDTFGTCMGETDEAKTPVAVAGRVLAITYRDREKYKIGDAVCSAPDGTVDKMSRREIRKYPDRIVGIVSEIPKYEYWAGGTKEDPQLISVNGRIWINVR